MQQKQPKRKPLGHAIAWTDQDLAEMSQVTQSDIKAAQALWRNAAPKRLAGLLDATVQQPERVDSHFNRF
jgi:hypothetical protein